MKSERIFKLCNGKSPPSESKQIALSKFIKKGSKTELSDELTIQINNLNIILKMN